MLDKFIKEVKAIHLYGGNVPKGQGLNPRDRAERLDPEHKAGFEISKGEREFMAKAEKMVAQFLAIVGDHCNSANFKKWLDELESEDAKAVSALIATWTVSEKTLAGQDNIVGYLDMERRQKYVLEPGSDGIFYYREPTESSVKFERKPYDTTTSTAAVRPSKPGIAIWVQGPSGRFYSSNESKQGKFHHSSFLAGRNVKAAGDWRIEQGRLKSISAMSGHYCPTLESLRRALLDLQAVSRQLLNWGCIVEVYKGQAEQRIEVGTFLSEAAKDSKYLAQFTPFKPG